VALPFMSGAANRMDGRLVYALSAMISALVSLSFAILADGISEQGYSAAIEPAQFLRYWGHASI